MKAQIIIAMAALLTGNLATAQNPLKTGGTQPNRAVTVQRNPTTAPQKGNAISREVPQPQRVVTMPQKGSTTGRVVKSNKPVAVMPDKGYPTHRLVHPNKKAFKKGPSSKGFKNSRVGEGKQKPQPRTEAKGLRIYNKSHKAGLPQ